MLKEYNYIELLKKGKQITKKDNPYPEIKVALLGDFATQQFAQILRASISDTKFFPDIYESEFDTINSTIINYDSVLKDFSPEYVYICNSVQKYRQIFYCCTSKEKKSLPQEYVEDFEQLIKILFTKNTQVILNTLPIPIERIYGNFSLFSYNSLYRSVQLVNELIVQRIGKMPDCYINDIAFLASLIGLDKWYDEKLWVNSKYMCSPKYYPYVTESAAKIIAASKGRLTKCLVLDLDNTLWGGIIGDDGIKGIKIGMEDGGESYYLFQKYLLQLKERGYILAVCSKNEKANAQLPFEKHPEMVLRMKDFAIFVANWKNKPENIAYISKVLNIELDSLIFIDDSIFERNQVRQLLPDVIVPELPDDPADFIKCLDQENLFETTIISKIDRNRTETYRAQARRSIDSTKFSNINDYLKSLDMKVVFSRFNEKNLQRVVQLLQRSNQFNLRTQRFSENQCREFMENEEKHYPIYVKVKDKYGDYGLIGVVCTDHCGKTLFISEWVMSCRAFKRGVEDYVMNRLVNYARRNNLDSLVGEYIKSPKNGLVKDFYKQYAFELKDSKDDREKWVLDLNNYVTKKYFISETDE